MALSEAAETYFKTMSPLAAKMYEDIEDARLGYEHLWQTLSDKEKVEIINETIIKPEITLKYSLDSLEFDIDSPVRTGNLMSYFRTDPGQRIVTDDNSQWRDEHSGPFLHHTRSQLDLCMKADEEVQPMSELALSHSKVVLELKNALKSHDVLKSASRLREDEPGGFLSKLIGGKCRSKEEDRQWLVSDTGGTTGEIVATNTYSVDKQYRGSVVQSDSGLSEERRGLLCSISQSSSTQEYVSCEELSSDAVTMRSGFDFLDNW